MIVPPATLGVLGGGQLGRYTVLAARTMGYRTVVLEPDPHSPAGQVAHRHLVAAYDDEAALDTLAATCAVVTTEFENPPAAAMERLAARTLVHPSPGALAVAQDRIAEKRFLASVGATVAPWVEVLGPTPPDTAYPAILKTARFGYDGKGQVGVASPDDLPAAWRSLGDVPCVVEQRLALDREVSVLVARTQDGRHVTYPVTENVHADGILDVSSVPARVTPAIAAEAERLAVAVAEGLDFVGLLGVEMFVVGGQVLVNEIAPRPHNSGHWTLDACRTSQFAQQVRAVCGLALGATHLTAPGVAMANLLGDVWGGGEPRWEAALAEPDATLHLYGKREPRPGRKMGHLTVTASTPEEAVARVVALRAQLTRQ